MCLLNVSDGALHQVVPTSVADPYHFDTDPDPDPGCQKIRYGSGSRVNFDTDPDSDPGKNDTDPAKKDQVPGKSSKSV